ncbi:transposase, partial [Klebsiella pneumoniae subsp. pneumoniae]|nr:transposase [Klebsiella pneumoniae subsp. pneumoniae]
MSRRKYTFQQRLEVVMHYFATDEGYRLTSARFNVPRTQVRIWVAAYDAYGEVYGSTTYCNFYSHVKYSPLASSVRV